ncbi:MAG: DNA topoisomerase I [Thaumarchaeota archaeon]|nr:DNA topoisomerase I [Nitrososphaerota archaeon]
MSAPRTSRAKSLPLKRPVPGHTLVICEKPDAARRVAEALSSGAPEVFKVGGVPAFRLEDARGRRYVVCAAIGHLYGVSDTVKDRRVYPVLDLEWFPLGATQDKAARHVSSRIRAIRSLSEEADGFVNACDFDIEGETIGYNILRYACGGKEASSLRARFSALTKEEVVEAFTDERLGSTGGLAKAGRLRHVIDFVWGINLSRALSESLRTGYSFRTVSMGRVQGPTLNFVVEREVDARTFVPTPYWTVRGSFRGGGAEFEGRYSLLPTRRAAEEVKDACEGKEGVVSLVAQRTFNQRPPPPLNLADLQKEAYRLFGYAPTKTLQMAERLYLGALISYPRTGSQRLPKLDYRRLLSRIAAIPGYSDLVDEVVSRGNLRPTEGQGTDPAHPAIYPTGESGRRPLSLEERKLFDLVVRRFLSCFGEDAVRETRSIEISVGGHEFKTEETRVLVPGWLRLAAEGLPAGAVPTVAPALREGYRVDVNAITVEEHLRARPARYNQATLLEKMEKEEIGTKATRADTISTLLDRGYVTGETLVPTELGFALIETMREHCPQIISTRLTREVEAQLEKVEVTGESGLDFFERTLSSLLTQLAQVRLHESEIAGRMQGSVSEASFGRTVLGGCPVCREGKLWVVRSRKSGKRFVGCTNYAKGCKASAPLPQRGTIKATSKPCGSCGWPVVYARLGRRPWRLCVNDRCPRKVNVYAMQILQKKSAKR